MARHPGCRPDNLAVDGELREGAENSSAKSIQTKIRFVPWVDGKGGGPGGCFFSAAGPAMVEGPRVEAGAEAGAKAGAEAGALPVASDTAASGTGAGAVA